MSSFINCGVFLPSRVVTNDDLSKTIDTSDEWIFSRTGIKSRRIAHKDEQVSDMATRALEQALKNSNILPKELDGIIVATTTPDLQMPSTACIVQKKINAKNAFAFDIQAVCSGFIYALSVANGLCNNDNKIIAVIGSDKMSSIVDWGDRNTCVLFGDGAGCFIIQYSQQNFIRDFILKSDGDLCDILKCNDKNFVEMNGKEVFKYATSKMEEILLELLQRNKLEISDVASIVCHQANARILQNVAKKFDVPMDKFPMTLEGHSNTSAASIPLAFEEFFSKNKIKRGDKVVLLAVGAGMTATGALLEI